jgi:peptidoglycan pentaglycine glycine transferase (the first glycine)
MKLQVVSNPDRQAWNAFVAGQAGASLYQSYEWGQIKQAQGWNPHYLAVADGTFWVGAALVLSKRLPIGLGTMLYSPAGPLSKADWNEAIPTLLEAVRMVARQVNALFWRIEPRVPIHDEKMGCLIKQIGFVCVPQEWSYWNRPKYDMHLDLSGGEAAVLKALGQKNRWNLKSALKKLKIQSGNTQEDLESFYKLLEQTSQKKQIPIRDLDYYRHCRNVLAPSGMLQIFVAREGHRPVAAGISTRYGKTAMLFHMSNDYSVKHAGLAVQWEMIRWGMHEGCRFYDFAGTGTHFPPRTTDKGYGVYQFKRSFGAEIVAWYGYADYVFRPALYRLFRAMERTLPYGERVLLDWPKGLLYRLRIPKSLSTEEGSLTGTGKKG